MFLILVIGFGERKSLQPSDRLRREAGKSAAKDR